MNGNKNWVVHNEMTDKRIVHILSPIIMDYTLCGDDIYSDDIDEDPANFEYGFTTEKINCKNCLEIIAFCKKIK